MYKVLIGSRSFGKIVKDGVDLLKKNGCELIENPLHRVLKEDDLVNIIQGFDGFITGIDEVTEKALEAADQLKVISKHGVGVDNIDVDTATKKGIVVTYTPAVGKEAEAVADFTFGLILSIARQICLANQSVKSGGWKRAIGTEIWGKVLGIVGTGNIGKAVIKRANGFNMRILAYDIFKNEELIDKFGVVYVSLEKLLRKSDFVTVHVPLNEKTRNLIGGAELRLMKPSAYLINAARGGIVDEKTLFRRLSEKKIAGAAIDAFSGEPPKDNPLISLDNVIATPHIAAYTISSIREMDILTADNTLKVLNNKQPSDKYVANSLVYRTRNF
ncbi:MAG: phosphoglycerate dehydrogenase [Candidatus Aerophobetes bacterium]|nr:phosphoglycerate dehydrogenase [Candidatus Aerophobetes bacterium]